MKKLFIATVAAAVVAAGGSAPAGAQSSVAYATNPIKIVRYSVEQAYAAPGPAWGGYLGLEIPGKITISYVNGGAVPATSVAFAVRIGKATETIVDKGTFSPGTTITHDFAEGGLFSAASAIEVEQVTFADGTSWQRA